MDRRGRLICRARVRRRSAIDLKVAELADLAADTAPPRSLSWVLLAIPILIGIMVLVDCRETLIVFARMGGSRELARIRRPMGGGDGR